MNILCFPDRYTRAWPDSDDPRAALVDVAALLTEHVTTDMHFAAYGADLPRRIGVALLKEARHADKIAATNLRMVLAVFDVDGPGHAMTEAWIGGESEKLATLEAEHPDAFVYTTRGGYRVVFRLPEAFLIRSQSDDERWTALYQSWCRYLQRRFAIEADTACSDWTRLYRAPFATRDGVPQRPDVVGNASALGVWEPRLAKSDRVRPRPAVEVFGAVEPVPIADPDNEYGQARLASAVRYLETAPLSIEGEGGRTVFFKVACYLVRRLRMPVALATDLIEVVYNPRLSACGTTTWAQDEIIDRLESARTTSSEVPAGDIADEETWTWLVKGRAS